jgi:hydrogenase expression/formation protein HypE
VRIDETAVPVRPAVAGACEALGLDVLSVANEGKFVVIVPPAEAEAALRAMRAHRLGREAAAIGEVLPRAAGPRVVLRTRIGGERAVDVPYGEDLPRIC